MNDWEIETYATLFAGRTDGRGCSVEGCNSPVKSRGLCNAHYQRLRRYGDPTFVPSAATTRKCRTPGIEVNDAGRTCTNCRAFKPWDCFYLLKTGRNGREARCKSCKNAAKTAWGKANPEAKRRMDKSTYVKRKFGLTLAEYETLVASPCDICGSVENIVLDHCHQTGRVRGPLCNDCNSGLGFFGDSPSRLEAAAAYLRRVKR